MDTIEESMILLRSLVGCQTAAAKALVELAREIECGNVSHLTQDKLRTIEASQEIVTGCINTLKIGCK
jgi:hypothetical protein